jgi:hypothetical protein
MSTPASSLRPLPSLPIAREVYPELGRAWPGNGLGSVALVAAQLPDPKELPDGALVLVHESGRPPTTLWGRLAQAGRFWRSLPTAHRAVRCTALLALGYRDVGVARDPRTQEEIAWGVAATSPRSS